MLESLINWDKNTMVFLNNLGNPFYDSFWLMATKQIYWTPFFLLLLYLLYQKKGLKMTFCILLFVAVLILLSDQLSNVFKYSFKRLRPCNDPEIQSLIRIVKSSKSYSFFSAHASNSMAISIFIFLNLKKHYKYLFLIFIWPLIFAYSRIYLGLHFPLDIISGYISGGLLAYLMFKIYHKFEQGLQNPTNRKPITNGE
jgi:undecaprenyl-diphosphatase